MAKRVIELHDGQNYKLLQEMSIPPKVSDNGHITEKMYLDMCSDIENELGVVSSIDFNINFLCRGGVYRLLR